MAKVIPFVIKDKDQSTPEDLLTLLSETNLIAEADPDLIEALGLTLETALTPEQAAAGDIEFAPDIVSSADSFDEEA